MKNYPTVFNSTKNFNYPVIQRIVKIIFVDNNQIMYK